MSDLVQKNKAVFEKYFPSVMAELEGIHITTSLERNREGEPENINLRLSGDGAGNGTVLYPIAAADWTAKQFEDFDREPDRLNFADPSHCNLSPVSKRLLGKVRAYFRENHPQGIENTPVTDVGFGFVFGVGLGYHIPELVKKNLCRQLVIIEPIPEFILHSFSAIDWQEIVDAAQAVKTDIIFITGLDPETTVIEIERLIITRGQTFLDGSFAYVHYVSWPIRETRTILNERLKTYYSSRGFFEDEVLMMKNTYENFNKWPSRVISRQSYLEQDMPVFIIGSGASLDNDLSVIRKLRDRVIVFSCGTSLGILLKNEIRPDLHVENENTPQLVNNLRYFAAEYGLEGITLVASTTVNSQIASLFDRRWFYFRSHLSPGLLVSGPITPLVGAAPLVSNAAFATTAVLGFRNVYFFGMDCGRRKGANHHARDAVYYEDGYDNYMEGESLEFIENEFNREVPGNFGGTVLTAWHLDMSRVNVSAMQRLCRVNLINCSDGAKIDGARPQAAAAVKIDFPPGKQGEVLGRVADQLKFFDAGTFMEKTPFGAYARAADDFQARFGALMDAGMEDDNGFWDLEQRVLCFMNDNLAEFLGVLAIIGGTYTSMIRLGAFGGNRIKDEGERLAFFRFFIGEYRAVIIWMAGEIKTMLGEMTAGQEILSEVGQDVLSEAEEADAS
ncbi:MAG TPA: DUF115 domain-containing protein [Alphaproteobacteria bacterium]|nr:DUF115 domain-containing protein [Alphaproteobacteria bacterium]